MHKQRSQEEKPATPTVIVKHEVAVGKRLLFEAWLDKVSQAAQCYSGYLGTEVMRPLDGKDSSYVSIFRFDTYNNQQKWLVSDERKKLLHELESLTSSSSSFVAYSGEALRLPHLPKRTKPVPRHKMALVTFFAIWALLHIVTNHIHPLMPGPEFVREMLVIAIIVLLMTYAVMPLLTKLLARWLVN